MLRFDADGWLADNTDGIGLVRDLQRNAGVALHGRRVLLVGAGGAAAGVMGPLIEARPAQLHVANRTAGKAEALVSRHAALAAACGTGCPAAAWTTAGEAYDVVLNSSASSLGGAAVPVADRVLKPGTLAVDLMYGAAARPFMAWAASAGRGAARRAGHAGRAGGRGLLPVAPGHARHGAGAAAAAQAPRRAHA